MNKFINAGSVLDTTLKTIYTCPPNSYAVIHTLYFSTTGDTCSRITIKIHDASLDVDYNLAYEIDVLPHTVLSFDKPINLDGNDSLKIISNEDNKVHVFASILHVYPMSL